MQIIPHEFSGEVDLQAMAALVHEFPADNLHTVDLPYRFSSWAFDYPENIRLWRNTTGQLLAWAVMQTPFWAIDYAYRPDSDRNLHRQLLAWVDDRAREIVDTPSGRPAWFVTVFTDQADRIRDLEEAGFASQANVGENSWSKLFMQHATQLPVEDPAPPIGFTIRPLAGEKEIEAYVKAHRSAFESKSMTVEWRVRTLNHPNYTPDVDLVAVAPDGRLVAFCICWLNEATNGEIQGQIEPLGVHPDFHKLGLGRAILLEGLRRLYLKGAKRIYVETDNYRNAAVNLYEAVGFRTLKDVLVYRKDYERRPTAG
jgi:ribosomal protein S18 acetylase RimI-like enzyme